MKNKGFTLIELLAVIVILAIIALIATPIILNIISDTKEESNKISVELYASSVKNAIAAYQLRKGKEVEVGTYSSADGKTLIKGTTTLNVEYDGSVKCNIVEIYEDGNIYLEGCNGNYTYGTKQVTTIYRFGTKRITKGETVDPTEYTTDASTLNKTDYLKHVLDSENKVEESWACAVFNGKETCVRGGKNENGSYYTENELILKGLKSEGFSCAFSGSGSSCRDGSVDLYANSGGDAYAYGDDGYCDVSGDGSSFCEVW